MTWIRTVPLSQAGERLRAALAAQQALYPREYAEPVHRAERDEASGEQMAGIVASHSLIPEALHHAFATYGALMSPELPLGRRQHELIATVVSLTNRCRY
jgi:alkylhydroperoxidase family enzyme